MDSKDHKLRVLMLPWLAHGHISPFLQLSKRLAQRNFLVYFCTTPVNISSIQQELGEDYSLYIQVVELHLPELPNLPPDYHTTKSLPPYLMPALKQAFDLAEPSFSDILRSYQPDVLIYDFIQPWAPISAASINIPAILFLTTGAAFFSFYIHFIYKINSEFPFPMIYLKEHEAKKTLESAYARANGITDVDRVMTCADRSSPFIAIKTSPEVESKYINYLYIQLNKEIVPVGPLVRGPSDPDPQCEFMAWLNKKETASTVFVSFGSEYFMSKEEIEDVAYGLDLSQVNFIWVIRFLEGKKMDIHEVLPNSFHSRVNHMGLIVEGWAPQTRILGHPSIGGFLTHCGWSSVMEGMSSGVPLIALPLHLDQPLNARLVVEEGVGLEVKRAIESNGRFDRKEVAKTIRQVMVDKDGEGVRRQAKKMAALMRKEGEEEIDKLMEKLLKLSHNNNEKNKMM